MSDYTRGTGQCPHGADAGGCPVLGCANHVQRLSSTPPPVPEVDVEAVVRRLVARVRGCASQGVYIPSDVAELAERLEATVSHTQSADPGDHCGRCCVVGKKSFPVGRRLVRFLDGKSYWFTFCEEHRSYDPAHEDAARRIASLEAQLALLRNDRPGEGGESNE